MLVLLTWLGSGLSDFSIVNLLPPIFHAVNFERKSLCTVHTCGVECCHKLLGILLHSSFIFLLPLTSLSNHLFTSVWTYKCLFHTLSCNPKLLDFVTQNFDHWEFLRYLPYLSHRALFIFLVMAKSGSVSPS